MTWDQDLGGLVREDLQNFTYSQPLNLADYPQIGNLVQDYSVTTQAASDRFEVSWSGVNQFVPTSTISGPDKMFSSLAIDAVVALDFAQDTRVRMTWNAGAGPIDPGLPDGINNKIEIQVSSQNGTIVPFNAGIGDSKNTITQPFSFEIDVLAGERIFVDIDMSFSTDTRDGSLTASGWDVHQNSSFVIEVVPAPTGLALIASGCIGISRRRRC